MIAVGVSHNNAKVYYAESQGCEYLGTARDTHVAFLKCNDEIVMRDSRTLKND